MPYVCRQARELDQLVDYEVKRAQIQSKAEAKLAQQEARAAEQRAQREEKEKAWREALREQELKRLAAEKEEEAAIKVAERVCPSSHLYDATAVCLVSLGCCHIVLNPGTVFGRHWL